MMKFYKYILLFVLLSFIGCTDKMDISQLAGSAAIDPNTIGGDTLYVQQNPVWTGFNKPEAILIGREPFVYVADTKNNRIVMLNVAGDIMGTLDIDNPTSLAQDFKLNLLVTGRLTTNEGGVFSAVFRINLFEAGHILSEAKIDTLLPNTPLDFTRGDREYNGICVLSGNHFYVGRRGPENGLINPDNAILVSQESPAGDDSLNNQDKLPGFKPLGTGILSTNGISSLTSEGNYTRDFVTTLVNPDNSFKVQWLVYVQTNDFTGYMNKVSVGTDLMTPNKFGKPEGSTFDDNGNLYVADAEKDSIYKFNPFGDELESFGGPEFFDSPHDVAHFNRTLYVLDTNNGRIVRYILSTEID